MTRRRQHRRNTSKIRTRKIRWPEDNGQFGQFALKFAELEEGACGSLPIVNPVARTGLGTNMAPQRGGGEKKKTKKKKKKKNEEKKEKKKKKEKQKKKIRYAGLK